MAWLTYLFGSGLAFFLGIACLLIGILSSLSTRRRSRAVSTISAGVGLVVIALSGTPLPKWFYVASVPTTIAALGIMQSAWLTQRRHELALGLLVALVWIAAAVTEARYQFPTRLTTCDSRRLYVVGDSISAGLNDEEHDVWPKLLAAQHGIEVVDYSRAGATTAVALNRVKNAELDEGVVLLEIGGNDLLGSTTPDAFSQHLDKLLREVADPRRQVVMFELPIPPFGNSYGRVQRRLAAKHHVSLIPKRILMGVLTADGSTVDSLHLSPTGHQRMADAVWKIIRPAYRHH